MLTCLVAGLDAVYVKNNYSRLLSRLIYFQLFFLKVKMRKLIDLIYSVDSCCSDICGTSEFWHRFVV